MNFIYKRREIKTQIESGDAPLGYGWEWVEAGADGVRVAEAKADAGR